MYMSSEADSSDDAAARPESRSARKRRAIMEAARELFAENGYAATSIDMVTERAGVSKPTVYGHFRSKAELFAAVVQSQAEAFTGHTCEVTALPPREGMADIGRMYLDMTTASDALAIHRAIIAEGSNFPELAETFYESGPARVRGITERYLEAQNARGTLRVPDPRLAAELFLGMLRVAFYRAVFGLPCEGLDADAVVAEAVSIMMAAYAPDQPQRE